MAYETLIVAYDTPGAASRAIQALRRAGVPASDIKRHPVAEEGVEEIAAVPAEGAGASLWAWLFGDDAVEQRIAVYQRAVQQGGTVLSIRVIEDEAAQIRRLLKDFGPLEVSAA